MIIISTSIWGSCIVQFKITLASNAQQYNLAPIQTNITECRWWIFMVMMKTHISAAIIVIIMWESYVWQQTQGGKKATEYGLWSFSHAAHWNVELWPDIAHCCIIFFSFVFYNNHTNPFGKLRLEKEISLNTNRQFTQ